jgi:hypothetical protein
MPADAADAAHTKKVRELAGPAADLVLAGPRRYPKADAVAIDSITAEGMVCLLTGTGYRATVYAWDGQTHAIITELVHSGYRRKYRKISGQNAAEVLAALAPA